MTDRETEPSLALPILLSLIGLYVGFATAIVVDELVLRTNIIHSHSPDWFIEAVRIAYWPVVKLVEMFF